MEICLKTVFMLADQMVNHVQYLLAKSFVVLRSRGGMQTFVKPVTGKALTLDVVAAYTLAERVRTPTAAAGAGLPLAAPSFPET